MLLFLGHPFKVVKVWFQNTRARDRREGQQHRASPMAFKHLLPPTPPASCSTGSQKHSSPATSPAHVEVNEVVDDPEAKDDDEDDDDDDDEEDGKIPLDLSTKASTPSASPPPLVINSEGISRSILSSTKKILLSTSVLDRHHVWRSLDPTLDIWSI